MVLAVPLVCIVLCQAPTTPLTGLVVGPNGEPVAGAEVLLGGLPVYDPVTVAQGAVGRPGPVHHRAARRAGGRGPRTSPPSCGS